MTREEWVLRSLDKKLTSFRKRAPVYFQHVVLHNTGMLHVVIPNNQEFEFEQVIDYGRDVTEIVRDVYFALKPFFPRLRTEKGVDFFIDKVNFKTNSFVLKSDSTSVSEGWIAIYKMKRPVFILLKEFSQGEKEPTEVEKLFRQNIKEKTSEEDYRVF